MKIAFYLVFDQSCSGVAIYIPIQNKLIQFFKRPLSLFVCLLLCVSKSKTKRCRETLFILPLPLVIKEFQRFLELKPHQILRPSETRWLSLQQVVNRIIEQCPDYVFYKFCLWRSTAQDMLLFWVTIIPISCFCFCFL